MYQTSMCCVLFQKPLQKKKKINEKYIDRFFPWSEWKSERYYGVHYISSQHVTLLHWKYFDPFILLIWGFYLLLFPLHSTQSIKLVAVLFFIYAIFFIPRLQLAGVIRIGHEKGGSAKLECGRFWYFFIEWEREREGEKSIPTENVNWTSSASRWRAGINLIRYVNILSKPWWMCATRECVKGMLKKKKPKTLRY